MDSPLANAQVMLHSRIGRGAAEGPLRGRGNVIPSPEEDCDAERTGAQVLVDCLLAQGVTTAFGVPGESYLAVLDALYDVGRPHPA